MPEVTEAFITGSYRYGEPTMESDLDLVILCDDFTLSMLIALCDPFPENMTESQAYAPIRFGKLNIIACLDQATYDAWKDGTEILAKGKPVTRDEACKFLKAKRSAAKCVALSK